MSLPRSVIADSVAKNLRVQIVDRNKVARNLTGYSARVQGTSDTIGKVIDIAGTISDATNGWITWTGFFGAVTAADLGAVLAATFKLRVLLVNPAGAPDSGPEFSITWKRGPLGAVTPSFSVPAFGSTHPFEFPFPLPPDRMLMPPVHEYLVLLESGPLSLFSQPVGSSGIVRNISLVTASAGGFAGKYITFNIKYDGEATPSVSVPILSMMGVESPNFSADKLRVRTKLFEITNSHNPAADAQWAFNLRYPIPYTNGIEIYLTMEDGGQGDGATVWSNIVYQNRLPQCWNKKLRFFATRNSVVLPSRTLVSPSKTVKLTTPTNLIAVSAGDIFAPTDVGLLLGISQQSTSIVQSVMVTAYINSRTVTVDPSDTVRFALNVNATFTDRGPIAHMFQRPAGESGYIAATTIGIDLADARSMQECNPRVTLDQELAAAFQWTSLEDFCNGAFFFDQWPAAQGEHGGCTTKLEISTFPIDISNGASVTGAGIPAATTVSGDVAAGASSMTLSAAATADGNVTLTIAGVPTPYCVVTNGSNVVTRAWGWFALYKSFYDYPIGYTNGVDVGLEPQVADPILWTTFYYRMMP